MSIASKMIYGIDTVKEITDQHICIHCKKPAEKFNDKLSEAEYNLSGLCQECQDDIFTDMKI